jgi:hypothetical protein
VSRETNSIATFVELAVKLVDDYDVIDLDVYEKKRERGDLPVTSEVFPALGDMSDASEKIKDAVNK